MYPYLRYLHVLSAILYFMLHGGTASVTFLINREKNVDRVETLTHILGLVYPVSYWMFAVMVFSGVALGFLGKWWSQYWVWTSLGILLFIMVVMIWIGKRFLNQEIDKFEPPFAPSSAHRALPANTASLLALFGVGGMAVILWLMMFKPF